MGGTRHEAKRLTDVVAALGLWAAGVHSQASAESAKDFYKGKTITALSGYGRPRP